MQDLISLATPRAAGVIWLRLEVAGSQAELVCHEPCGQGMVAGDEAYADSAPAAGSEQAAKAAGKVRLEGKDYVMGDGDVVEFRFRHDIWLHPVGWRDR